MNLVRRAAILASCCLFLSSPVWSRHLVGGNMSYTYIGPGAGGTIIYGFTLNLYRDCLSAGAYFDDPANIAIYRGDWDDAALYSQFQVPAPVITSLPISTNCVSANPALCYEEAVYTFQRSLPALGPNERFFIVYQRCCRAVTLSNILQPDQVGATIMVELTPAAMSLHNSSPVFPPYPTVALCVHRPINIPLAATDSANDVLTYRFYAPFTGGGPATTAPDLYECQGILPMPPCAPPYGTVGFLLPVYHADAPMAGDPLVQIDSASGLLSGTPHTIGQFLAGVWVLEYRNRVLLSSSYREITFVVFDENAVSAGDYPAGQEGLQVFPNPAHDQVTLRLSDSNPLPPRRALLSDAFGRTIRQASFEGPECRFLREGLPGGMYGIRVEDAAGRLLANGRFLWQD